MSLPATKQQQLEEVYKDVWDAEEEARCKAWLEVLLRHTIKESGVQYGMVELAQLGLLDIIMQAGNPNCELSRTVPSLVQSGFPMDLRGLGWKILLDVLVRRARGQYDILVAQSLGDLANKQELTPDDLKQHTAKLTEEEEGNGLEADNPLASEMASWHSHARVWLQQIEKDLPRTFAGHPMMQGPGRQALRRVLAAFTMLDPKVGYCQGMNFIAAVLLMFMPEEDAFWCLVIIVEQVLTGYFSPDMMATKVDQRVFQQLVATQLPAVAVHLEAVGADISCVFAQWFLCAFVNSLPLETCLRVWDVLFYQKSSATLFQIGLALVDMYSEALLAARDVLEAFQVVQGMAALTHDATRLLALAMVKFSTLDNDHLQTLRHQARAQVEQEELEEERAEADRQMRQQNLQDSGPRVPDFRMSVVKKLIARALDKRTSESKVDLDTAAAAAAAGPTTSESGSRQQGSKGSADEGDGETGDDESAAGKSEDAKVTPPPHSVPDAADSPLLAVGQVVGAAAGKEQELEGSYVPPEVPLFPEARDFISLSPSESTAVPDIDDLLSVPSLRRGDGSVLSAAAAAAALLPGRSPHPSAGLLGTYNSEPAALPATQGPAGRSEAGQSKLRGSSSVGQMVESGPGQAAAGSKQQQEEEGCEDEEEEAQQPTQPVQGNSKLKVLDALLWTDDPLPPMQQHPATSSQAGLLQVAPTSTPAAPPVPPGAEASADLISISTNPSGLLPSDELSKQLTGELTQLDSAAGDGAGEGEGAGEGDVAQQLGSVGSEAGQVLSQPVAVTPKPTPAPPPLSPAMELALQIAMRHTSPRSAASALPVNSRPISGGDGLLGDLVPPGSKKPKPTSPMAFQGVGPGSQPRSKGVWGVEVVGSVNSALSVGLSSAPTEDSDGTQGGTSHHDVLPHHTHGANSGVEFKDDWVDLHVGEDLTPHSHSSSLHNTAGGGVESGSRRGPIAAHAARHIGVVSSSSQGVTAAGGSKSGSQQAGAGRELRKTISNGWVDGGLHPSNPPGNHAPDSYAGAAAGAGAAGTQRPASKHITGADAASGGGGATRPNAALLGGGAAAAGSALEAVLHEEMVMSEVVTPAAVQEICEQEGLQPILSRCLELHYRAGNLSEVLAELQGGDDDQPPSVAADGSDGNIMKALVESASCGWVEEVVQLLQQAQQAMQQQDPQEQAGTAAPPAEQQAVQLGQVNGGGEDAEAQGAGHTAELETADAPPPGPPADEGGEGGPATRVLLEQAPPADSRPPGAADIKSAELLLLKHLNNDEREMGITHAAELLCGYQWLAGEACDKLHHMAHKLAQQQAVTEQLQAKVAQLTQRLIDQENDLGQLQALAEEMQVQAPYPSAGMQGAGGSGQLVGAAPPQPLSSMFRASQTTQSTEVTAAGAAGGGDGGRFIGALQKLRERSSRPLSPPAWAVQGHGEAAVHAHQQSMRTAAGSGSSQVEVNRPVSYGQEGGAFGVNFWGGGQGQGQRQGWRGEAEAAGGQRQEEGRMSKWLNRLMGKEEGMDNSSNMSAS